MRFKTSSEGFPCPASILERLVFEMPAFWERVPSENPRISRCARTDCARRLVVICKATMFISNIVLIIDDCPLFMVSIIMDNRQSVKRNHQERGWCELRTGSGSADSRCEGSGVQCDKCAHMLCLYSLMDVCLREIVLP